MVKGNASITGKRQTSFGSVMGRTEKPNRPKGLGGYGLELGG